MINISTSLLIGKYKLFFLNQDLFGSLIIADHLEQKLFQNAAQSLEYNAGITNNLTWKIVFHGRIGRI